MRALPDVTSDSNAQTPATLQWVGMDDIAVPLSIAIQDEKVQTVPAKANLYISLDKPDAKGIHMSRLHSVLNKLAERECAKETLDQLLDDMIDSQQGIGKEAKIELAFDLLLSKAA